jgi:RNA polymerase sigma factor (sigma-70 family)
MDDLIQLVRAYLKTAELADRERLADAIFSQIEPELRRYVNGKIRPQYADDVLQEVLKAVVISLPKFSSDDFMSWCRGIARNKIYDQYQANAKASERFQALPPEEVTELVSLSVAATPLATGERLDLDYAMKLLAESKPECVESLLRHYVDGLDYGEIAEEQNLNYDAARMKVGRCLETVRELVA